MFGAADSVWVLRLLGSQGLFVSTENLTRLAGWSGFFSEGGRAGCGCVLFLGGLVVRRCALCSRRAVALAGVERGDVPGMALRAGFFVCVDFWLTAVLTLLCSHFCQLPCSHFCQLTDAVCLASMLGVSQTANPGQ